MIKLAKNKLKILSAILVIAAAPILSGCGGEESVGYKANLEIWGPIDDSSTYTEIVNKYKELNPYIGAIKYRKFSQDSYKKELLNALAEGQGPDIFLVNNSWMPFFENKIEPAPAPFASETDIKSNFPDIVASDFLIDGKVFALPLGVDSLALYYNKDMFNSAGIPSPPSNWQEFDSAVEKLTVLDSTGKILRSGAAIGTAENVNRAPDILSVLMMQRGIEMPSKKGMRAKFDEGTRDNSGMIVNMGEQSLEYYTKFAKMTLPDGTPNPLYTWNSDQHDSIEAFSEGTVGMMFNYSWRYDDIKAKNEKLNFGVAPIPQENSLNPMTMGNYWGFAVSKYKITPTASSGSSKKAKPITNAMRTHEAWEFLRFLTIKNAGSFTLYNAATYNSKTFPVSFDPAKYYIEKSGQPAARRDLIENQKNDTVLGVFARGNLIAKNWYKTDSDAIDQIMLEMIESINRNEVTLREALASGKNRVNSLSK